MGDVAGAGARGATPTCARARQGVLGDGMKALHHDQLSKVTGGFGALLGAALQAAPGILNGVAGIIGASKSGKGGGGGGATAAAAAGGGGGGGGYAAAAGAAYAVGPAPRPPSDGGVDVSVQVANGAAAQQAMRGLT